MRRPNRKGEGALLRDEILRAAAIALNEAGADSAVSLRAIARQAGIAPASVYEQFTGRDAILWELRAQGYTRLAAHLRSALTPGLDARRRVHALAAAHADFAAGNPGEYRLLFEAEQTPIPLDRLKEMPLHLVLDAMTDALRPFVEEHGHQHTARELAVVLLSTMHGHLTLWRALPLPPELDTAAENRARAVDAILGPGR
ncbi:AcrR family transcriptional regulator [Catenuloplanes nepalensis]|uniref:AcrR family transcriptional regulator n=1 Tax=Catenuloplanes nepalensis TaxID=587533 RepID=A0ABT9MNL2_9ACTN|nr:TetR/AcrR family transcriptional regulator [Catenuloplanes nepalensis]MDP9792985.1 AcrR family transcriptional regulator [Catenuloplanes nepalensis]